jgi:hypothetical protein
VSKSETNDSGPRGGVMRSRNHAMGRALVRPINKFSPDACTQEKHEGIKIRSMHGVGPFDGRHERVESYS